LPLPASNSSASGHWLRGDDWWAARAKLREGRCGSQGLLRHTGGRHVRQRRQRL